MITMDQKNLETKTGDCPFAQLKYSHHYGIYLLNGKDQISYECIIDDGVARGGEKRKSIPFGAVTPCSISYARDCPLYKKHEG